MQVKTRTPIPNSFKVKRKDIDSRYLLVTDTSGDLVNIHYKDNINETWSNFYGNRNRFCPYGEFRGWVVDTKTNQLVCRSFSKTREVYIKKANNLKDRFDMYYKGYEGTIVRIFKHNDKLYKTTHKKLDIEKSRWGNNKTFSQQFDEALENYDYDPNSTKNGECHVFILIHPENQIINSEKVTPSLYHLDTWTTSKNKRNGIKMMESTYKDTTLKIPKPKKLTYNEAVKVLDNGGFIITPENRGKLKIMTYNTANAYELRGNEPNLFKRWFNLIFEYGNDTGLESVVSYTNKGKIAKFPKMYEEYMEKTFGYIWGLYNGDLSLTIFRQSPLYTQIVDYLNSWSKTLSKEQVKGWLLEHVEILDSNGRYQLIVAQNKKIERLDRICKFKESKEMKLKIPEYPDSSREECLTPTLPKAPQEDLELFKNGVCVIPTKDEHVELCKNDFSV